MHVKKEWGFGDMGVTAILSFLNSIPVDTPSPTQISDRYWAVLLYANDSAVLSFIQVGLGELCKL